MRQPRSNVMTGMAAEALVMFRLLSWGIPCHRTDVHDSAYDLIADYEGRLLRIQVKGASATTPSGGGRRNRNYGFKVSRGNIDRRAYGEDEIDLFAFVAVDMELVRFQRPRQTGQQKYSLAPSRFSEENEFRSWREAVRE